MPSTLKLALLSCALLGFRHGFDYDHLAAITDITSVQRNWREGMRLGLLYALGHAFTVAILGGAVILLHLRLPERMDALGERLVGVTLIVLAIYVAVTFFRQRSAGHQHLVVPSRITLLVNGGRHIAWRMRKIFDRTAPQPEPFSLPYHRGSVFGIGVIHGLGAETPSQLMLFLLAANLGGTSRGLLGLACFIAGLLVMNTVMTASASGVFLSSNDRPRLQLLVTSVTAAYSFIIGTIFLFGIGERLPPLLH